MFEYHGWATVRDSLDGDHEAADCLTQATYTTITGVLNRADDGFQTADLRVVNGSCHLWHRQKS